MRCFVLGNLLFSPVCWFDVLILETFDILALFVFCGALLAMGVLMLVLRASVNVVLCLLLFCVFGFLVFRLCGLVAWVSDFVCFVCLLFCFVYCDFGFSFGGFVV